MTEVKCLICGGATESGFVLDRGQGLTIQRPEWGAGEPQYSFWTVVKKPQRRAGIVTFRCTACGFLMNFAREQENA